MKNIAIFASGTGSNFAALQAAFADPARGVHISVLVCDHAHAAVVAKARTAGVPVVLVNYKQCGSKAAAEQYIISKLPTVDLIVLAGFMRILGPDLLAAYPRKIINLHPALLPSFPGRTGIADAYEYGVKVTGVTVHYVDAGVDSGEIIAQEPVRITAGESLDELETAIHAVEHVLLPNAVTELIKEGAI
jgi:phosphoribosylglycinamide formyltransferase-1